LPGRVRLCGPFPGLFSSSQPETHFPGFVQSFDGRPRVRHHVFFEPQPRVSRDHAIVRRRNYLPASPYSYTNSHADTAQRAAHLGHQSQSGCRLSCLSQRKLRQFVCSADRNGHKRADLRRLDGFFWPDLLLCGYGSRFRRRRERAIQPGHSSSSLALSAFTTRIFSDMKRSFYLPRLFAGLTSPTSLTTA
jgi:hypothetical protein